MMRDSDTIVRDQWLRKRVFQLEEVIDLLIKAHRAEGHYERMDILSAAREKMPE